jgi:hypothetical protein
MWASVVLFILTFAILGLLLGIAAVYHVGPEGQKDNLTLGENVTANVTQSNNQSSSSSVGSGS